MNIERIKDELAQAWTVAVKDVRVYYLRPGMIMFGFLMPFFMFFSFSVKRDVGAAEGVARLLAMGDADPDRPTVIFAYTITGWQLPFAGDAGVAADDDGTSPDMRRV